MEKYKLIKKYPGSPKLGTEVSYSETHKIYNYNGGDFYSELPKNQVEGLPEYWEKVVEKDYEILSYQSKDKIIASATNFAIEISKPGHWNIHSVKRISDGEIFTVGDKVKFQGNGCSDITTIFKFEFVNDKIHAHSGSASFHINFIHHIKKPLFTTEDGVDIFEGDTYYVYQESKEIYNDGKNYHVDKIQKVKISNFPNAISDLHKGKTTVNLKEPTVKRFSTKEAAEEYILMNKPCLSINDVMSVAYNPVETRTSSSNKLKEIVKSKL